MNRFIFSSSGKTKSTTSQEVKCNRTVRLMKESIRETLFAAILLRQSTGKPKRGKSLRGSENPASSARSPSISAAKPCSPKRTMIPIAKCKYVTHSCFSQPPKPRTKAELNNNQEAQLLQDRIAILVFQTFCDSAVTLARQTWLCGPTVNESFTGAQAGLAALGYARRQFNCGFTPSRLAA